MASGFKFLTALNESQLFRNLRKRENVDDRKTSRKPQNLLVAIEDHLLVWEPAECALLVTSLANKSEENSYKKLLLSDPPLFDVFELLANPAGSHIVLYGEEGVACVELPLNWTGKLVQKQQTEITVKSFHFGDNLINNPRIQICQVLWHPGSSSGSHVTVLSSDNMMRIFQVYNPSQPEKIISVGSRKSGSFRSSTTFSARFEDSAVSFDFGQPVENTRSNLGGNEAKDSCPSLLWPVYILHASGEVYTFLSSLDKKSKRAIVSGPLPMWPSAEDNYCTEACSLLCLPTSPPVLVIGTRHWTVHHAILLPRSPENEEDTFTSREIPDDLESLVSWSSINTGDIRSRSGPALNVVETLELDANVIEARNNTSVTEEEDEDCNLRLFKDPSVPARYFVSHAQGLHVVAIPLVLKLAEFVAKSDDEVTVEDTKLALAEESLVEFLLATQTRDNPPAPPIGVIFHSLPPSLLVLLDSLELEVILLSPLLKPPPIPEATTSNDKARTEQRESFEARIRRILQRTTSQPKLRLPEGSNPAPEDVIKLFSRCVQVLRDEYMNKQDLAREEIQRRAKLLSNHLQQQIEEISMLHQTRNQLTDTAHHIAERYEDCRETQDRLTNRIEKVLLALQRRYPVISDAEKQMNSQLRDIDAKLKNLTNTLNPLKRKQELYNSRAKPKVGVSTLSPATQLTEVQQKTVKETLAKQSEEIAALLKTTKLLTKDFNL